MINMLVPPKNCATSYGMFIALRRMIGMTAIKVKKIAPASVMRLIALMQNKCWWPGPGRTPGNVPAVFLHVIGNLQFIELRRDPEIGEEQDHQP